MVNQNRDQNLSILIFSSFILSQIEKLKVNATVIEALPDTKFRVQLDDGREIIAYLAGKMRMNYIKVMMGDKVTLELSPDGTKGRIVRRL